MKIAFPVPVPGASTTGEASRVLVAEENALLFGDVFDTLLVPKDKLIEPETTEGHGEIEQTDDSTGSAVQETQPEEALIAPIVQQNRNEGGASVVASGPAHAAPLAPDLMDISGSDGVFSGSKTQVMTQLASYALGQLSPNQAPDPDTSMPVKQDMTMGETSAKLDGAASKAGLKDEVSRSHMQSIAVIPQDSRHLPREPGVAYPQRTIETTAAAPREIANPAQEQPTLSQSNFIVSNTTQVSSVAELDQPAMGAKVVHSGNDEVSVRVAKQAALVNDESIKTDLKIIAPVDSSPPFRSHNLRDHIDWPNSNSGPLLGVSAEHSIPVHQSERGPAPVGTEGAKGIAMPHGPEATKTGAQIYQRTALANLTATEPNRSMPAEVSPRTNAPKEASYDGDPQLIWSKSGIDPPAQMISPTPNGPELPMPVPTKLAPSPALPKATAGIEAFENTFAIEPVAARSQEVPPAQNVAKLNPVPQIIPHLADLSVSRGDKIEITLSPDELGRVRLAATQTENGVVLVVQAERPETLDLMRRHMSDLLNDLQDMGFADINYSDGQQQDQSKTDAPQANAEMMETTETLPQTPMLAQGGLDLRL